MDGGENPSLKEKSDSQSAHDNPTRNSGGRSWEQDAIRAKTDRHTGVSGETAWIKQVLKKCLKREPQSE